MVDGKAAIKLGEGRKDEGAEDEAKYEDGDDEAGEEGRLDVKFFHEGRDSGCEHCGGEWSGHVSWLPGVVVRLGWLGTYVMRVMRLTRQIVPQRRKGVPLSGFVLSSGPSQPTIYILFASRSAVTPGIARIACRVTAASSGVSCSWASVFLCSPACSFSFVVGASSSFSLRTMDVDPEGRETDISCSTHEKSYESLSKEKRLPNNHTKQHSKAENKRKREREKK